MPKNLLARLDAITDLTYSQATPDLEAVREDKSGKRSEGTPLVVVFPRTTEAVQALMRVASEQGVPVVPRGGGSGLAGGAIGTTGEIVLELSSMNSILEISPEDRLARVQAGVLNIDLNEQAGKHGLWFGPDPASRKWATVGGNIATNAGGLLCAKYGVTRESVLALKVVLADGRLISMGHRSVKGVTGLDLCHLMIGSEGVLGIIVEATVKLLPINPAPIWTISAEFNSVDSAAAACQEITRVGLTPAILELMDSASLRYIRQFLGSDLPPAGSSLVVCQTDGGLSEKEASDIETLLQSFGAATSRFPSGSEADALLEERRSMHPAMEAHGTVLIEDVSVPRSKLQEMFAAIRDIESTYGVEIPTVAHAADGNLHPNFIYGGDEVPGVVWEAADELFRRAIGLGGTLTGEHGIGILKKRWLADEIGHDQWELQRAIKEVFDPQGILNPGKVF